MLPLGNRPGESWITCLHGKGRKYVRLPDVFWNLEAVAFEQHEKSIQIMNQRETGAALDENSLDGLLGGLLRMEAPVLQVDIGDFRSGTGQVASRPVAPLARIVPSQP